MLSPDHHQTPAQDPGQADPRLLREDHVLCLMMDAALAVRPAIRRWLTRRRTRQVLAALDEHQLRDIGLTRAGAGSQTASLSTVLAWFAETGIRRQETHHAREWVHRHRPAA